MGEARRRLVKGQTMRQIADHFNVAVRTVQRRLRDGDKNHPRRGR